MYNLHQFEASALDTQQAHEWVTVPNPTNKRILLQACDNCGVVKSENTVIKHCGADSDRRIISRALIAVRH